MGHIESITQDLERRLGDDSESIITDARYQFVTDIVDKAVIKARIR